MVYSDVGSEVGNDDGKGFELEVLYQVGSGVVISVYEVVKGVIGGVSGGLAKI